MSTSHAVLKQQIISLLNNGTLVDSQEAGAAFVKLLQTVEKDCMSLYGATTSPEPGGMSLQMPWYTLAILHNVLDVRQADWWRLTSTVSLVLDSARTLLIHAIHVHALRLAGDEAAPLFKTVMGRHADWWLLHTQHNAHQMDMFNLVTGFVDSLHELQSANQLAAVFGVPPETMGTALQSVRQNFMHMLGSNLKPIIADIVVVQHDMTVIPCLVPIGSLCLFHRLNPTRQDVLRVVTKDSCVVVQTVDGIYHKIFARGISFYVDLFVQNACQAKTEKVEASQQLHPSQTTDQMPNEATNRVQTMDSQAVVDNQPQYNQPQYKQQDPDDDTEAYNNKPQYIAGVNVGSSDTAPERQTNGGHLPNLKPTDDETTSHVTEADTTQRLHQERLFKQKETEKRDNIILYLHADRCLIYATDFARQAFRGVALKQRQNDIEHRETKIEEVADYIGGQSEALQQLRSSEEQFWQNTILPQLAASKTIKQYNKIILRQTAFAAELRAAANEIAHA